MYQYIAVHVRDVVTDWSYALAGFLVSTLFGVPPANPIAIWDSIYHRWRMITDVEMYYKAHILEIIIAVDLVCKSLSETPREPG